MSLKLKVPVSCQIVPHRQEKPPTQIPCESFPIFWHRAWINQEPDTLLLKLNKLSFIISSILCMYCLRIRRLSVPSENFCNESMIGTHYTEQATVGHVTFSQAVGPGTYFMTVGIIMIGTHYTEPATVGHVTFSQAVGPGTCCVTVGIIMTQV